MRIIQLIALNLFLIFSVIPAGIHAQENVWAQPVQVGNEGAFPTMTFDTAGVLHLIWTAQVADKGLAGWGDTLFYARYDGASWSQPIDVLASPAGVSADFPTLLFGPDGMLHVFWRQGTRIQHSRADPLAANSAQAWKTQGTIHEFHPNATGNFPYEIVVDDSGRFHAVYSYLSGNEWGMTYSASDDGGRTWADEQTVTTLESGLAASLPRVAVSQNGDIHIVWVEFMLPNGWPLTGVYYANSLDGGRKWSPPFQLGGESQGYANIVASGENDVHVVWNGSPPAAGRYHRWSEELDIVWEGSSLAAVRSYRWSKYLGRIWSVTELVSDSGGLTQGWPTIVADSAGTLHMFMFAGSERGDDIHYVFWEGNAWSEPTIISPGEAGGYTGHPASLVAYGNEVHVVWARFSREGEPGGIWYSRFNATSPHNTSLPIPAQRPVISEETGNLGYPSSTPAITESEERVMSNSAPQATLAISTEIRSAPVNPTTSILLGIFPVVIMIALAVFIPRIRGR